MTATGKNDLQSLRHENQQLKSRLEDYEKLHRVLEAVSSFLEVDEVMTHITEEALNLCQADQGSIMLFDPAGQHEAKTLIRHAETENLRLDHFLNMMLAGWVSKHRQALLSDDLAAMMGRNMQKDKYRQVSSALSVPLMLRGEMIGILNLIRLEDQPPFGERELNLLNVLASIFAQFIYNARLHDAVFSETLRLRKEVQDRYAFHGIIGQSPQLKAVFAILERVIPTEARVLIEGESGTGKELIARVIHYSGPRKDKPFVAVDCGALPANLLESELFGYVKGAFTGATRDKKGLFETASGGTLFLDEIVNMPPEIQSKLLRAIQEGEIRPLGSTEVRKVDVRILSAAGSDLKERLASGKFRQDLFYRLNVVSVQLPLLRERKGDIAILANHFLKKMTERHGKSLKGFRPETMAHLEAYHWPGNVRELENIVERLVILTGDELDYIPAGVLPIEIRPPAPGQEQLSPAVPSARDLRSKKSNYEKAMLLEALANNSWNQSAAARELGVSERTVRYQMKKFGIEKPD